ncbi:hypothetical protein E2320_021270, partial [Naja naja]
GKNRQEIKSRVGCRPPGREGTRRSGISLPVTALKSRENRAHSAGNSNRSPRICIVCFISISSPSSSLSPSSLRPPKRLSRRSWRSAPPRSGREEGLGAHAIAPGKPGKERAVGDGNARHPTSAGSAGGSAPFP